MADPDLPPSSQQTGESNWSLALKALFWFIAVPVGVILLVKWLLQP